ncbi:MAG: hypothetical protein H7227_00785 [Actinobacteria bacterium]|nr:hypothetical protein [Actinomycetota bacterium]
MRVKTKSSLIVSLLLSATIVLPFTAASAATVVAGHAQVIMGCENVTLSLRINDAFLKLPTAQQTEARKNKAIAAETMAMNEALKSFKAAAKLNSKWKTFASQIDTMLHTDEAAAFTKSFTGVVSGCLALKPLPSASPTATIKAIPKATSTKK